MDYIVHILLFIVHNMKMSIVSSQAYLIYQIYKPPLRTTFEICEISRYMVNNGAPPCAVWLFPLG